MRKYFQKHFTVLFKFYVFRGDLSRPCEEWDMLDTDSRRKDIEGRLRSIYSYGLNFVKLKLSKIKLDGSRWCQAKAQWNLT